MATLNKEGTVTLAELLASSPATADALAKLMIEKGIITETEFRKKLSAERASYAALQGRLRNEPTRNDLP